MVNGLMRKTKIICTLGPSSSDEATLRRMMEAGMDVARFNFSHGTHEEHLEKFRIVDRLREELGLPIGTMLDTKGPEIRLGVFENGAVMLQPGAHFILTPEQVPGTEERSYITCADWAGSASGQPGADRRRPDRTDGGLYHRQGGDPHHSQERRQGFQPQGCQCARVCI